MNIFKQKYTSLLLDNEPVTSYIFLDQVSGFKGKEIYSLLKNELRKRLINGNVPTVKKIMNIDDSKNYDRLNGLYRHIYTDILKKRGKGIKTSQQYLDSLSEEEKKNISITVLKYANK